jgi:hypothetical protein
VYRNRPSEFIGAISAGAVNQQGMKQQRITRLHFNMLASL